jgi:hypothetical protein
MKEWCIEDRDKEVFILHGETYTEKKKIYPNEGVDANVTFYLLYNDNKLVGYKLLYLYDEKYPKFKTYNSFGIVYNKRKTNFKTSIEVIFEDSFVRFLAYENTPNNVKDYFLVGRWKHPNSKYEQDISIKE